MRIEKPKIKKTLSTESGNDITNFFFLYIVNWTFYLDKHFGWMFFVVVHLYSNWFIWNHSTNDCNCMPYANKKNQVNVKMNRFITYFHSVNIIKQNYRKRNNNKKNQQLSLMLSSFVFFSLYALNKLFGAATKIKDIMMAGSIIFFLTNNWTKTTIQWCVSDLYFFTNRINSEKFIHTKTK